MLYIVLMESPRPRVEAHALRHGCMLRAHGRACLNLRNHLTNRAYHLRFWKGLYVKMSPFAWPNGCTCDYSWLLHNMTTGIYAVRSQEIMSKDICDCSFQYDTHKIGFPLFDFENVNNYVKLSTCYGHEGHIYCFWMYCHLACAKLESRSVNLLKSRKRLFF